MANVPETIPGLIDRFIGATDKQIDKLVYELAARIPCAIRLVGKRRSFR